jgi:hypothetical protein
VRLASRRLVLPAAITLIALLVYWRTLLPSVSNWGDSAKFQYLAQVWGIPHPTGYPLYLLLTRLFAMLPWGDVAYRVNLLSAVCGALAAGVLALVALKISRDPLAAGAAALLAAFSPIFWSQAVVAEVYALNAVWVVLCLLLILRWRDTARPAALFAFMLAYGLSFSHHLSMVLLLPAFVFWAVCRQPGALIRPRNLVVGLLAIGLGIAPYSYILLRASQGAVYSEFPALAGRSWLAAFVDYVSGAQFRSGFFAAFAHGPAALLDRAGLYAQLLVQQFGWWGIALGGWGLVSLWRRDRQLTIGLILAWLGETIFALGYDIIDPEVYFIPSYLIWTLFIAGGLSGLAQHLAARLPWPTIRRALWTTSCLALPLLSLVLNWPAADRSHDLSARRWAEAFMQNLEDNALVVMPQPYFYSQRQILLYMMLAEGVKPGLKFIHESQVDRWVGRQPVYLAVRLPELAERYRLQAVDSSQLKLAGFLASLPERTIVAAAAKDEASLGLSRAAAGAWHLVGGQLSLQGCFRCAHALIGVIGAPPGAALEAAGPALQAVQVRAGAPIGSTGALAPLLITVRSAGFDAGNLGEIWLGGWQVSPEHRGYNIAAITPDSGQLLATAYVDTFENDLVDNVRKYRVLPR